MIEKGTKSTTMAASPQPLREPDVEPVNALDLQSKMGIAFDTLSRAIRADPQSLKEDPRAQRWQNGLRLMADVWANLLIMFADEGDAREFLTRPRPELRNRTAIDYFDDGRPRVVLNLVCAMREMLPQVVPADDETLARIVRTLNIMRVSTLVFRAVPLKYATSVDSVEGARIYGGRYNPPAHLAASLCSLPEGFGYLYTATNPLTCLFECEHVLRGLGENEFQMVPVEPTLLVSFRADADNVLDLRDPVNQQRLGVEGEQLTSLDDRADLNEAGELTVLQRIGVAAYKSGRFSGVVVPSRFGDIAHGYCFNFLPREVKPKLRDHAGILRKINFLASP